MWNNFDNSMQVDGGGFMNDSVAQETQKTGQNERGRGQNTIPLLIGHLNNAKDADVRLWGTSVSMTTIVAVVRKIEQATTKLSYDLEDETGTIKAIQWLEANKPATEPIKLNTYVRCFGMLRDSTGIKHLMLIKIMPVTDLAEVVMHLLEVTAMCLQAAKNSSQTSNDTLQMSATFDDCNDNINGLSKEQAIIFNIIQTDNDNDCGINRSTIKQRVPSHLTSQVDDILNFLSNEGHIYTTSTDDNFKAT